jgi:hypothetical protein
VVAVTVVPKTGRSPGSTKPPQGLRGSPGVGEGPGPIAVLVPLAAPAIAAMGHGIALRLELACGPGLEEEHPPAAKAMARPVASKSSFPLVFMIPSERRNRAQ